MSSPKSVKIPSEGYTLDADLYLPSAKPNGKKPGIIVLCQGLGLMKSMGLAALAEHFTTLGLAALTFDYRGYGASTGRIPECVSAYDQIDDADNVLDYIRRGHLTEIDSSSISIRGISFSGGVVLAVAGRSHNADLKAVIALVPFIGTVEAATKMPPYTLLRFVPMSLYDIVRGWLSLQPLRVPVAGKPHDIAVLSSPGTEDRYYKLAPQGQQSWTHEGSIPARFLVKHLPYRPTWNAARIKCPTLVVAATNDALLPFTAIKRNTKPIRGRQFHSLPCGHFDVFEGGSYHQQILDLQDQFLKTILGL